MMGTDAHMDADALNGNESTVIVGRNPDADYAVVPLLVQTEYPANSATAEVVLPKGVEVLSYASTDADLISADDAEQAKILHQTYAEQSAAATGFYVKAFSDFTAQFVYASPDGTTLQKSIHVQLSDDAAPAQLYADNRCCNTRSRSYPALCHRQNHQHCQRGRHLAYLVQRTRSLLLQSWSERSAQWLPDLHF